MYYNIVQSVAGKRKARDLVSTVNSNSTGTYVRAQYVSNCPWDADGRRRRRRRRFLLFSWRPGRLRWVSLASRRAAREPFEERPSAAKASVPKGREGYGVFVIRWSVRAKN